MAGSGFKKFLRLVVCKISFYLFMSISLIKINNDVNIKLPRARDFG